MFERDLMSDGEHHAGNTL